MADADDTSGKTPLRRKDTPIAAPSPFPSQNQNLGSLPMGAMGQGLQSSGPAEWVSMAPRSFFLKPINVSTGMAYYESVIFTEITFLQII